MIAAGSLALAASSCLLPLALLLGSTGLYVVVASMLRLWPWRADRVELLRKQYKQGCSLQQSLTVAIGSPQTSEQVGDAEDRARCLVREWTQETWSVIHEHFGAHEKDFPGVRDRALGETEPALVVASEAFVEDYLERALDFVAELLEKHDK